MGPSSVWTSEATAERAGTEIGAVSPWRTVKVRSVVACLAAAGLIPRASRKVSRQRSGALFSRYPIDSASQANSSMRVTPGSDSFQSVHSGV